MMEPTGKTHALVSEFVSPDWNSSWRIGKIESIRQDGFVKLVNVDEFWPYYIELTAAQALELSSLYKGNRQKGATFHSRELLKVLDRWSPQQELDYLQVIADKACAAVARQRSIVAIQCPRSSLQYCSELASELLEEPWISPRAIELATKLNYELTKLVPPV